MYLAVALILTGEALVRGSVTLLAYLCAVMLVFHLTVVLYEEMEGVWSSGVALRGEASNHPEVR